MVRLQMDVRLKRWKHPDRKMNKHLFLASHVNHPTNKWVRMCRENYMMMYTYYRLLCDEYTYRYGKNMVQKITGGCYKNHLRICI